MEMIKNRKKLEEFEKEILRRERINIMRNLRIIESLYKEAVDLKVFPLKEPLDGIDIDIKIARVVNNV